MESTIVDRLYHEFHDIIENINQVEVSLQLSAEDAFRKNLLVTAVSYFEREINDHVMRLVEKSSGYNEMIVAFVRNKAIERQFYTYFQWNTRNANSFFGLFGEGFKSYMTGRVNTDEAYARAIRAFLELGSERNRLVHQDFGTFQMEKTSKEIFHLYRVASLFVNSLENSFDDYLESTFET